MDLQTIQTVFYTLGSIFFLLLLMLLIVFAVTLFLTIRKVLIIKKTVERELENLRDMYDKKEKYILRFATRGSGTIVDAITGFFSKKRRD